MIARGVGIWGVNQPVGWGFAIINFVWWIGIGHAGTLISAILLLMRQQWRTSINRFAEAMTLFAVACAGLFPLIHMGRPWKAYYLFPLPNTLALLPQFRSPLVWDVFAISTYMSAEQDRGERAYINRLQTVSAVGLLLYGLTGTFSAIDWAMSLEPHWFSGIYGLAFIVGQILTALAFIVPLLAVLSRHEPLSERVGAGHFHDLGNLILAFVMLWAYVALSQYLIIWSANLPEETPWILNRTGGGWEVWGALLIVFHFALPFVILLQRVTKRRPAFLAWLAGALFVFRLFDLVWLVKPAFSPGAFEVSLLDLTVPLGIGGTWGYFFVRELKKRPLLPLHDPRFLALPRGVEHG